MAKGKASLGTVCCRACKLRLDLETLIERADKDGIKKLKCPKCRGTLGEL